MLVKLMVAAAAAVFALAGGALGQDGARAYHLLPQNTHIISLSGYNLQTSREPEGLVPGSDTDVLVFTPSYRQSVDVFGNAGVVMVSLPVGGISTTLDTLGGNVELETDMVPGDLLLSGFVGLVGSPSLAVQDYVQYKPGLRVTAAARLFLPTGEYDAEEPLNFGTNRWSLYAALPISYVLGDTMVDPELTTFELVPSVQIYGDNEEPFGGADVAGKAPVYGLEGHITRSFGHSVWAALDAFYEIGGETSTNGVGDGNEEEELALGATLGLNISPQLALRLTYREAVYSNVPDSTSRNIEISAAYLF